MNPSQWSDLPLVLTSDQAAAVLQVNRRTLTNMLDRGILRGVKIGKEWRVSREEIRRFVEGASMSPSLPTVSAGLDVTTPLVNKGGLLVIRAEPLADLSDVVKQAREQRVVGLIQQAGL